MPTFTVYQDIQKMLKETNHYNGIMDKTNLYGSFLPDVR